jgi:sterol desaturase/sphingolipid hydroxylase (fatty acid hydroxylase superfamily)
VKRTSASLALDYAILPLFVGAALLATWSVLAAGVPDQLAIGVVIGGVAVGAGILERIRPERADYVALDQPLYVEVLHFLFNYQLGYALGFGACLALPTVSALALWPHAWPLVGQVLLAGMLGEALSYWQHRLFHTVPWLWRFHRLHHSGSRLNLVRTARFHFVDLGVGAFLTFLPLVVLGAPPSVVAWVGSLTGTLGVLSHANIRMRAPVLLSRIICTPAMHRHHHSLDAGEGATNYGTLVTFWDVLFGSYATPRADGPAAVGVQEDPTPSGFWAQTLSPFRRR